MLFSYISLTQVWRKMHMGPCQWMTFPYATHTRMHVCVREISNLSHPHQSLHILCRVSIGADGAAVRKTTGISSVID